MIAENKYITGTNSRIISADVIRVLAILMAVFMHTILDFTIRPDFFLTKVWFVFEPLAITAKIGVLLFFMLSGYLVINKNRSIKENLNKTFKRVFIPLCFFVSLSVIFDFNNLGFYKSYDLSFWQHQLIGFTGLASFSQWFLTALLFMYLLNPVWSLVFSQKDSSLAVYVVKIAFAFAIISTILKYPTLNSVNFFNNFTLWTGLVAFYLFGGLVRNNWVKFSNKVYLTMIVFGFTMMIAGDFYAKYTNLHGINIWSSYFTEYLSVPTIITAVGLFGLLISQQFNWFVINSWGRKSYKVLKNIAILSFGVFLIQPYVVSVLTKIGFDFDKLHINVYLYNLLNYSLVLGISLLITFIIRKIPKIRMVIGE